MNFVGAKHKRVPNCEGELGMKSILVATAKEQALSPLADSFQAPMMPLIDRPVMVYAVELLARHGIKNISVVLFPGQEDIKKYFQDGRRWNVNLSYINQNKQNGDAALLKERAYELSETFLILPSDSFLDFDITAALAYHRQTDSLVTVILSKCNEREVAGQRHYVQIDTAGSIVKLGTQSGVADLEATGAFICESRVLDDVPENQAYNILCELLPKLHSQGHKLSGFVIDGYWNALNSFAAYKEAQEACLAALIGHEPNRERGKIHKLYADGRSNRQGLWRAHNSVIHPSAQITGPAFVGEGCQIGADVELGPNVVIGSHVVVDEGATIRNSTVLQHTYVGQLVELNNRIVNKSQLIDVETGEYTNITDDFLLSEASSTIVSNRLKNLVGRAMGFFLLVLFVPMIYSGIR